MDYIAALKTKYKVVIGKDVNAAGLKPIDILATIGTKTITVQNFEDKAKLSLYETQMNLRPDRRRARRSRFFIVNHGGSKISGIQPEELIAREISNKMKDFSNEEREQVKADLQKRLFQKYNAKILLKEPAPYVQKIARLTIRARLARPRPSRS